MSEEVLKKAETIIKKILETHNVEHEIEEQHTTQNSFLVKMEVDAETYKNIILPSINDQIHTLNSAYKRPKVVLRPHLYHAPTKDGVVTPALVVSVV
jgi:hypothetical protein